MEERLATRSDAGGDGRHWRCRTGAKGLVASSDRVLLVAETHADGSRFWTLPGGGVRPDESLATGLRREIGEELCCRSVVASPVTRVPYAHRSLDRTVSVYTVFECALLSEPVPAPSEGVVDVTWADPSAPPTRTLPFVRGILDRRRDD